VACCHDARDQANRESTHTDSADSPAHGGYTPGRDRYDQKCSDEAHAAY